jgi:hypothetical protein
MGVRLEVQLAAAPVGYVRVQLRGREVGVAEHLLDASEVCPALEQVGGEGMAKQMRVHTLGVESCLLGQAAQDQERAGARQWAAANVEKELRPVAAVEVRTAECQVTAERLYGRPAERDDALLRPLAERADEASVQIDRTAS